MTFEVQLRIEPGVLMVRGRSLDTVLAHDGSLQQVESPLDEAQCVALIADYLKILASKGISRETPRILTVDRTGEDTPPTED